MASGTGTVAQLYAVLGIDPGPFVSGMEQAKGKAKEFQKDASASIKSVAEGAKDGLGKVVEAAKAAVAGMSGEVKKGAENAAQGAKTAFENSPPGYKPGALADLFDGVVPAARQAAEQAADELDKGTKEGGERAARNIAEAGEKARDGFVKAFRGIGDRLKGIGVGLTAGVTAPIVAFAKSALDAAGRFDVLERSMQLFLGTPGKVREEFKKLYDLARMPGLEYEQAIVGERRLLSLGRSASDARGQIEAFAKANSRGEGSAENFAESMRQWTQMMQLGKVRAEDLNIVMQRLPDFGRIMREKFGTSSTETIQKAIESGKLTMDGFVKGMVSGMQALPVAMGGITNDLENLKSDWTQLLVSVGKAGVVPLAAEVVQTLTPAIQGLTDLIDRSTPAQREMAVRFVAISAVVGPLVLGLGALMGAVANMVEFGGLLSTAWAAAGAAIADAGGIVAFAGAAFSEVLVPIAAAVAAAYALYAAYEANFGGIRDAVLAFVADFKEFVAEIIGTVVLWVQQNRELLTRFGQAFVATVLPFVQSLIALLRGAWDIIKAVFRVALDTVLSILRLAMQILTGDWAGAWDTVKGWVSRTWEQIQVIVLSAINALLRTIKAFGNSVASAFGYTFSGLDDSIGAIDARIATLGDTASKAAEKGKQAAKGLTEAWSKGLGMIGSGKGGVTPLSPKLPPGFNPNGGGSIDLSGVGEKAAKAPKVTPEQRETEQATQLLGQLREKLADVANGTELASLRARLYSGNLRLVSDALKAKIVQTAQDVEAVKAVKKQYEDFTKAQNELVKGTELVGVTTERQRLQIEMNHGAYSNLYRAQRLHLLGLADERDAANAAAAAKKAHTDAVKALDDAYTSLKESLEKSAAVGEDASKTESLYYDLTRGKLKGLSADRKEELLAMQAQEDERKRLAEAAKKSTEDAIKAAEDAAKADEEMRKQADERAAKSLARFQDNMRELATRAGKLGGALRGAQSEALKAAGFTAQEIETIQRSVEGMQRVLLQREGLSQAQVDEQLGVEKIIAAAERARDALKPVVDTVHRYFDDLIDSVLTGFKGGIDGFLDMTRKMLTDVALEIAKAYAIRQIFGGGGIDGFLGRALSGSRATGGSVNAGEAYLINEGRPEVWVPPTSGGRMEPVSSLGGSTVHVTMNIMQPVDARGIHESKGQLGARIASETQVALHRNKGT